MRRNMAYDGLMLKPPRFPKLCPCHDIPDYECPDIADSQPDWDAVFKSEQPIIPASQHRADEFHDPEPEC